MIHKSDSWAFLAMPPRVTAHSRGNNPLGRLTLKRETDSHPFVSPGAKSPARWYSLLNMKFRIARLDHIQIAAPEGCEPAARDFYGTLLGMREIEKPEPLRARGGWWCSCAAPPTH